MTHDHETATDNFAHIIAVRQAEADRKARWEKHLDEWEARKERERPWFNLIVLLCLAVLFATVYFMSSP